MPVARGFEDTVGAAGAVMALGEGVLVAAATVATYLAVMTVADRPALRAKGVDQTQTPVAECAIEIVWQKRRLHNP